MAHTHYLIIYPFHERILKSLLPEAKIQNGRFYPTLYAYGNGHDLHAVQTFIKEEMKDPRTMLVKLDLNNPEHQLSDATSAGI